MQTDAEEKLPQLRQDLQIIETSPAQDGSKRWRLFDKVQNKYFSITLDTFKLISQWDSNKSHQEFIKKLQHSNYNIDLQSLHTFIDYLKSNNLTVVSTNKDTQKLIHTALRKEQHFLQWLLHNYLFIRIPLVHPDKWLEDTFFFVRFFYTKLWTNFVLLLGIIGVFLALRNWDVYVATFADFFSYQGMFYYLLSLIFIKGFHELGHAYTAKKYGCNVPTMGVAFLVLFPLLYTDTTDAWKLKSKYERLRIVFAGVKVELYIAMLATFFCSFTENETLKSIFFILATTSWITSLLLNISPFLRFDGYYALSDWTDSENLQPRSFAMAKWFLRNTILGLNEIEPEYLSKRKKRFFIIYALFTWLYRLVLFFGIALLVYTFAFKLLGIILFLVEIIWFILLPIFNEFKAWWHLRKKVTLNMKNIFSLLILTVLISSFFIPFQSTISLPAIIEVQNHTNIYATKNAQIKVIHIADASYVKKEDLLLELLSPDLNFSIQRCKEEISHIQNNLKKYAGFKDIRDQKYVFEENLLRKQKELEGLLAIKNTLTIKAPYDGYIVFNQTYSTGQWINTKEPIFSIYDDENTQLKAFVASDQLNLISLDSSASFISDIAELKSIKVKIKAISDISLPYLAYPELSSQHSGKIATRDSKNKLYTENTYYQLDGSLLDNTQRFPTRIKGNLIVDAKPKTMAQSFYIQAVSLFIRESGF
ncbi:HlyD family efflux transporter periplasmic adaptor subunit [Sulfurimonas sp.]|nr:HlyD family efflux transporter periplasmic adaptor subunit [Sulfurimonas sp.]